jgi:hypothetical protein
MNAQAGDEKSTKTPENAPLPKLTTFGDHNYQATCRKATSERP